LNDCNLTLAHTVCVCVCVRYWMHRSYVRADLIAASTLARPTNPSVRCV
jgi:hypothetical protein